MTGLLHAHDRSGSQRVVRGSQDRPQPVDDVRRPRVPQAEDHDADGALTGKRRDLSEIQVEGHDHPSLAKRFREHLTVRQTLQPFLAQMNRIMTLDPKPLDDSAAHSHVGQHAQGAARHDA